MLVRQAGTCSIIVSLKINVYGCQGWGPDTCAAADVQVARSYLQRLLSLTLRPLPGQPHILSPSVTFHHAEQCSIGWCRAWPICCCGDACSCTHEACRIQLCSSHACWQVLTRELAALEPQCSSVPHVQGSCTTCPASTRAPCSRSCCSTSTRTPCLSQARTSGRNLAFWEGGLGATEATSQILRSSACQLAE